MPNGPLRPAWDGSPDWLPDPPEDIVAWDELNTSQNHAGGIPTAPMPGFAPDTQRAVSLSGQVPPFWQFKPTGGTDLSGQSRGVVSAGAGSSVILIPVPDWRIIPGYNGVLAALAIGVSAPTAALDIRYVLLRNGAPVPGWTFTLPPYPATGIMQTFTGPLQLEENTVLTVQVLNNGAGGPWDVQADLSGWMWPRSLEQSVFGGVGLL